MTIQTPVRFQKLRQIAGEMNFTMPADEQAGSLLRTLIAAKPGGHFLELGTGAGLSLAFMADGLHPQSRLISIDNDPKLIEAVSVEFEADRNVSITCTDGATWITNYTGPPFDLIFADTWPGKYELLEETLSLLKPGGFYVIDDMTEQPTWPRGHAAKAEKLSAHLLSRSDLRVTRLEWSTGVFVCTKTVVAS